MSNQNTKLTDGANLGLQIATTMIGDMIPRRASRYMEVCFNVPEDTEVRIPLCGFHASCECIHVFCAYHAVARYTVGPGREA